MSAQQRAPKPHRGKPEQVYRLDDMPLWHIVLNLKLVAIYIDSQYPSCIPRLYPTDHLQEPLSDLSSTHPREPTEPFTSYVLHTPRG